MSASCTPAQLLTVGEVAEMLRVSRAQVYLLKDDIGWTRIGARGVRFRPESVFLYLEKQTRCRAPVPASTATLSRPSGMPSGQTVRVTSTVSRRVAEIMERQARGLRRAN